MEEDLVDELGRAQTEEPPLDGAGRRLCWSCQRGSVKRVWRLVREDGQEEPEARPFWRCQSCGWEVPARARLTFRADPVELPDLEDGAGRVAFLRSVVERAMGLANLRVEKGEGPKSLPSAQAKALEVALKAVGAIRDEVSGKGGGWDLGGQLRKLSAKELERIAKEADDLLGRFEKGGGSG